MSSVTRASVPMNDSRSSPVYSRTRHTDCTCDLSLLVRSPTDSFTSCADDLPGLSTLYVGPLIGTIDVIGDGVNYPPLTQLS